MKDNLDRWIVDAKDEVPDSGEYRRLNRALLKERMLTVNPDRSRRHRVLVMAACLVIVVGLSGQISQLGSDSFDTNTSSTILALSGDTVTIHSNTFRGGTTNLPEDYSEADVDEYNRSVAAEEGIIVRVFGVSYGGKTNWMKIVRREINGKIDDRGEPVINPKAQDLKNGFEFYKNVNSGLTARIKTEPPHGRMQMVMDGVLMDMDFWTFEYPGYGEVTRYDGIPVEK